MKLRLRTKIVVGMVAVLTVGATAITGVSLWFSREAAQASAIALTSEIAEHQAARVAADIAAAVDGARGIADLVAAERSLDGPRRAVVNRYLARLAAGNPAYAGVWVDMADNGFDGRDADFAARGDEILGLPNTGRMSLLWLPSAGGPRADDSEGVGYAEVQEKEYYKAAATARKAVVTEPYLDDLTKQLMTSAAMPVLENGVDGGKVIGVAGIDLSLAGLTDIVRSAKPYGDGYVAVLSASGHYVAHPEAARLSQPGDDLPAAARRAAAEGRVYEGEAELAGRSHYLRVSPIRFGRTDAVWSFVVAVPQASIMADANRLTLLSALVGLVCVAAGTLIALAIGGGLARPLAAMTEAMKRLADGDLATPIPALDREDEAGTMARAVDVFKGGLIRARDLDLAQKAEWRAREERATALATLQREFEGKAGGLSGELAASAVQLKATAEALAAIAARTNGQAASVASTAQQSSGNVQTVAATTDQLSASIRDIGRQVDESARIAGAAVTDVERTNETVAALAEGAQRIGDVVTLIQSIAAQTNLLALNATIEAARAGEAGKGFAVVAQEVKNLANQTAKATEDIVAQVDEIRAVTGRTVTSMQGIGETIAQVNRITATIAAAVEEQGAATEEIVRNIQQAAHGSCEVSDTMGGIRGAAAETGVAASQVLAAAVGVAERSKALTAEVDGFFAAVHRA
ncbi:methyl-accepting chemotaxis protein [Azospirillum agricola]|uniref:methyl-accepting chemotaxis protein n=1 Tax=Azospirillum agricola TaxID=1720247 RepID=UPI000A0F394C|nr:methyl-accepting chemotaxis protein [Azospirillum agricola]SMH44252.1 methyl-accepting chemotaxis sensory transducer with Cache sensor [Azospirillum lipoferum]